MPVPLWSFTCLQKVNFKHLNIVVPGAVRVLPEDGAGKLVDPIYDDIWRCDCRRYYGGGLLLGLVVLVAAGEANVIIFIININV